VLTSTADTLTVTAAAPADSLTSTAGTLTVTAAAPTDCVDERCDERPHSQMVRGPGGQWRAVSSGGGGTGYKFSKVGCIVILCSVCSNQSTFENFWVSGVQFRVEVAVPCRNSQ